MGISHLVTISPGEVLDTDVLVGVFHALLKRRKMLPVFPVLIPEIVCIETTANQAGNDSASRGGNFISKGH